jgi:hypothetical protein
MQSLGEFFLTEVGIQKINTSKTTQQDECHYSCKTKGKTEFETHLGIYLM